MKTKYHIKACPKLISSVVIPKNEILLVFHVVKAFDDLCIKNYKVHLGKTCTDRGENSKDYNIQ